MYNCIYIRGHILVIRTAQSFNKSFYVEPKTPFKQKRSVSYRKYRLQKVIGLFRTSNLSSHACVEFIITCRIYYHMRWIYHHMRWIYNQICRLYHHMCRIYHHMSRIYHHMCWIYHHMCPIYHHICPIMDTLNSTKCNIIF